MFLVIKSAAAIGGVISANFLYKAIKAKFN